MKKIPLLLSSILLISIATTSFAAEETMMMDTKEGAMMMQDSSALENVTTGKTIRGIVTPDTATGKASAHYAEGEFVLHAEFTGLTTPQGDDFYEGWAVQRNPFKFISTGELTMKDGKYVNHFMSDTDYRSYDFYVLTLEPNDGDAAPADHIFEGEIAMKAMMMKENDTMMKDKMIMEKETMMKDDTAMMEKKAAMMAKKDAVKAKIQSKVKNLSQKKIDTILQRVAALRVKLETLSISAEKKASYNETLDIFVEVLESGEMMVEKEETIMQK